MPETSPTAKTADAALLHYLTLNKALYFFETALFDNHGPSDHISSHQASAPFFNHNISHHLDNGPQDGRRRHWGDTGWRSGSRVGSLPELPDLSHDHLPGMPSRNASRQTRITTFDKRRWKSGSPQKQGLSSCMLIIGKRLQALKQKIDEHKKHLEELDKHVADTMAHGKK